MDALEIVVVVVAVVLLALAAGGFLAAGRRERARAAALRAELEQADVALAQARAADRGWDRDRLEAAARAAWATGHGDAPLRALHLVQVVDRPGTEADEAVFRAVGADGHEHAVTLARAGDDWRAKA